MWIAISFTSCSVCRCAGLFCLYFNFGWGFNFIMKQVKFDERNKTKPCLVPRLSLDAQHSTAHCYDASYITCFCYLSVHYFFFPLVMNINIYIDVHVFACALPIQTYHLLNEWKLEHPHSFGFIHFNFNAISLQSSFLDTRLQKPKYKLTYSSLIYAQKTVIINYK